MGHNDKVTCKLRLWQLSERKRLGRSGKKKRLTLVATLLEDSRMETIMADRAEWKKCVGVMERPDRRPGLARLVLRACTHTYIRNTNIQVRRH